MENEKLDTQTKINNTDTPQFDSFEEINTGSKFIRSPKIGEHVQLNLIGFQKITDPQQLNYTFEVGGKTKSATNCLSNVDYGIRLHTKEGATFWVGSWSVYGQLKAIAKKLNIPTLKDVVIDIYHANNGREIEFKDTAWIVSVLHENQWKSLNRDTLDWIIHDKDWLNLG